MNKDELAARLRASFLGELEDQVRAMNTDLLALEKHPADLESLKSLFRVAHTLKGAARAANVPLIEQVCHALETLLARARDGKALLGPAHFSLLFSAADALTEARTRLAAGAGLQDSALLHVADALRSLDAPAPRGLAPAPVPAPATTGAPEAGDGSVRVRAEKLDALVASAVGLVTLRSRTATRHAALEDLQGRAARLAAEWRRVGRRLRVALERPGGPPAAGQAFRQLEAGLHELSRESTRLAASATEDLRAFSQATDDLFDQARGLRMRPFAEACEALPRAVRDLATAARKEADLAITGGAVEADRTVIDGLREALLHLVRNAVDHGIETPDVRERAGKTRCGTITVAAVLRGDRVVVTVTDDGAGLHVGAVRAQLERRGMPAPSDTGELLRVLLRGGISTTRQVTPISGRGVGLDVVRTAVERLGGSLDVAWEAGRGTTFTVECPLTVATVRAVLVSVSQQTLAIPTSHIERLLRVRPGDIRHAEGRHVLAGDAAPVPLVALARLLPPLVERPAVGPVPVVVLRDGDRRLGVAVDELLTEQVVVQHPLSRGQSDLPHLSGAALLGSGQVALVLNPLPTIATGLGAPSGPGITVAEPTPEAPARRRILVVDDSITTRTLEQSILEAAGYEVLGAVDGADAWRVLQETGCDLVVTDIEMPRMDGFALCEAIRSSARFKNVPVVLVTALETVEHRQRGLDVRADAYIGKSSFDQQNLVDTVRQLLGSADS